MCAARERGMAEVRGDGVNLQEKFKLTYTTYILQYLWQCILSASVHRIIESQDDSPVPSPLDTLHISEYLPQILTSKTY